jgi:Na+-transporting methylmalonyl-CoA/oxaloacetate decarboxylase gamma subunit
MKKLWKIGLDVLFIVVCIMIIMSFLSGCQCVAPEIIPDNTGDSVIMMDIKSKIEQGKEIGKDSSWLWWYAPVLFLVVAWGIKEFFLKKEPDDCDEDESKKEKKEVLTEESKPE